MIMFISIPMAAQNCYGQRVQEEPPGDLTSRFATKHFATNRFTAYRLRSFAVDSLRINLKKQTKSFGFGDVVIDICELKTLK